MIIISTSLTVPTQPSPRFHVRLGYLSGTVKRTIIFATWRKELLYLKKQFTKLNTPNNQTFTNPVTILNEEKYFYEHLYRSENPDVNNVKFDQFFQNEKVSKLDDKLKKECEGNMTIMECRSALKEFEVDKTPGVLGGSV